MTALIQVAICDGCPTIRYGLQHVLGTDPSINMVAEITTHEELLTSLVETDLDIILMDLEAGKQTAFYYLRKFRELRPDVKTIFFTGQTDRQVILEVIEMGVQGYQLKQAECHEIINAIHIVYNGGTSLAPCVTTTLMEELQNKHLQSSSQLSKREQQVLDLIAVGKTNNDIAKTLYISVRTVKFHVSSILEKLNVRNRTEAALTVL